MQFVLVCMKRYLPNTLTCRQYHTVQSAWLYFNFQCNPEILQYSQLDKQIHINRCCNYFCNFNLKLDTFTHVGFYGLWGLSIGVMVFILYKLYVLLPYTYPTPKLSPHRRRCISTFPPKNTHCMIYKHFKLWGHWKCPHKSPSPCNTYVIPMSLYKFVSS